MASPPPLLHMDGIAKRFGGTQALLDVSFGAPAGQVTALIGENGAGKSTLMKILSGALAPDAGRMTLGGQTYAPSGPLAALQQGVAMIYQELTLAPDLSVEDNIMLGQECQSLGILDRGRQQTEVRRALDLLGHPELRPDVEVGRLSVGAQQLVEIARALVRSARVIVFDEPTSSLPQPDVEHLFAVIRKLRDAGLAIVYISHFLEEIRALCDRYVVLRDGQTVGEGEVAQSSEREIVTLMVGRSLDRLYSRGARKPGDVVLSLEELSGQRLPRGVSLELRRGEIIGLAGLVGAGRTELLRAVYGLDAVQAGTVRVRDYCPSQSPAARIAAGLGMVSEDRKSEGLAQIRSIADNVTYSRLAPYASLGWLDLAGRNAAVVGWMSNLRISAAGPEQEVQALSGGNQQKVALARVLHQEADVLLLDEPTRGIDVGAKAEIYRRIDELASAGKAIIFVSSYLPELLAVCDRVGVLARGRLREVRPVEAWSEETLLASAIDLSEVLS